MRPFARCVAGGKDLLSSGVPRRLKFVTTDSNDSPTIEEALTHAVAHLQRNCSGASSASALSAYVDLREDDSHLRNKALNFTSLEETK